MLKHNLRLVNTIDRTIARSHQTGPISALRLIDVPPHDAVFAGAAVEEPWTIESSLAGLDWLFESERARTDARSSAGGNSAENLVDRWLTEP